MPSYPVLEIEGPESDLELAVALFMDHGCLGTEELPARDGLRVFFPEGAELEPLLDRVSRTLPRLVARAAKPVPLRDWLEEWKKSFTGFALGESAFILPTWKPDPELVRSVLRIDPEQAFGTGTHDTTRLCASLLERFVRPRAKVIDAGAGTGILAMLAARLGASSVVAFEPDLDAARCASENLERNDLGARIRVVPGRIEDAESLEADLIVANIVRPILEGAVERMRAPVIILSGLLVEEVDEFAARLPDRLEVREVWTAGDWGALVLVEPP